MDAIKSLIVSLYQETMVDFINGRHSSSSILDVFASGLLGKNELTVAGYF